MSRVRISSTAPYRRHGQVVRQSSAKASLSSSSLDGASTWKLRHCDDVWVFSFFRQRARPAFSVHKKERGCQALPTASWTFDGYFILCSIKPGCSITGRQGSLRSLTAFFFDRFAMGLRWAAAQTCSGARVRETRIVAMQASLLAISDAPPACFRHWRRQAPDP